LHKTMNNRQRVIASINHQQPDKIPYAIGFTQKAQQKMAEFYGDAGFADQLGNCLTWLDTEPDNSWNEVAPDIWQDQFGVQWNRAIDRDIGNVCNQLVTPETLEAYVFPNPDEASRYANYEQILSQSTETFTLANLGFSLYERAWTLTGMENLMMAMITDKAFVHTLLDRILEFNLGVIENVCRYDVDAMIFGDDWGMQTGLQMGAKLWREFIYPRIQQMYALVKSKDKYVFIHSCGKVDGVFPDLIEIGLDVFNPFQPEVMDVFEMKRQFGERLTFFGGISVQKTLPYGSVAEVKDEVRKLLEMVGKNGGYIAAPSHDIPGDAKPENIHAMIEVLQNQ
jgi:uroporphyrinogen decarboxylase